MSELLEFIEDNQPDRWALTFNGDLLVTLEYFGPDYRGDKEISCGDWEALGTIDEVLTNARKYVGDKL